MGAGSSEFVANNFIVNPGLNAIHFYSHDGSKKVTREPTLVRSDVSDPLSAAQVAASHQASRRGVASTGRSPDPRAAAVSLSDTVTCRVAL